MVLPGSSPCKTSKPSATIVSPNFGPKAHSQVLSDYPCRNIVTSKPIYCSLLVFKCSGGESGNLEGYKLMTLICLGVSCFIMVFMLFFLIQLNIIPRWDQFLTFLRYSPNLGASNIFLLCFSFVHLA